MAQAVLHARGINVVIFQPLQQLCALLFFKGALLQDPDGALKEQGENTRSALRLEFRSVADVTAANGTIAALVQNAIHVEQAGLSVPKRAPANDGPYPEELGRLLDADPALRDAWERLTPAPGAAGCSTSAAPSSPGLASRGSSALRRGSWKASGCTTRRPNTSRSEGPDDYRYVGTRF